MCIYAPIHLYVIEREKDRERERDTAVLHTRAQYEYMYTSRSRHGEVLSKLPVQICSALLGLTARLE